MRRSRSLDIIQMQARQDDFRIPDIQFCSRLMRFGVVNNHSQLVFAGREVSWEHKVEQIVDRFAGLPSATVFSLLRSSRVTSLW